MFVAATIWAATVVVATWPMMLGLQARLGGRRWLAVAVMTGAMLLVLIVPLALAVTTIVDYADDIVAWVQTAVKAGVPSPPEWVGRIPLVGAKLYYVLVITHDFRDIFTRGGFVYWGGFMGSVLACWLVIRWRKLPFLRFADVAAGSVPLDVSTSAWASCETATL